MTPPPQPPEHTLRIRYQDSDGTPRETVIVVAHDANLRAAIHSADLSPYGVIPRRVNCGGRGLCATCGVWIEAYEGEPGAEPAPEHWHDRIGSRFGYPRLSCQVRISGDMTVRLLSDKWLWGQRETLRRWLKRT